VKRTASEGSGVSMPSAKKIRSNSLDEREQHRILNDVSPILTNDTGIGSPRKGAACNLLDRPANISRPVCHYNEMACNIVPCFLTPYLHIQICETYVQYFILHTLGQKRLVSESQVKIIQVFPKL